MGLFGSKTKIYVSSAAMHLMDAGKDPLVDAIMSAILENENIVDKLMDTILNSSAIFMKQAYRYARDDYTLGLPSGKAVSFFEVDEETVAPIIQTDLGLDDPVLVDYAFSTPGSVSLSILPELTRLRGYNITTGQIVTPPPGWDIVGALNVISYDTDEHRVIIKYTEESADLTQVTVTYELQVWTSLTVLDEVISKWITIDEYDEVFTIELPITGGALYVVARYQELNDQGIVTSPYLFWFYDTSLGLYDELSGDAQDYPEDTYLPVVPIRYNNVDLADDDHLETPLYITSEKLLKKLKINIQTLRNRLNENPDIGEIDHAYVMWGINLQTDFSPSLWYLGQYFDHLLDLSNITKAGFDASNGSSSNNYEIGTIPISSTSTTLFDAVGDVIAFATTSNLVGFTEHGLNISLAYDYITSTTSIGSIGRPGTATKEIDASGNLRIKMQINKYTIQEIYVVGLVHRNLIYKNKAVATTPAMVAADEDENNLVIPIQYQVADGMTLWQRSLMYNDATLMIINSWVKVKIKWYQRGFFKVILILITIVIAVFTQQYWLVPLVAAMGAGGIALLLYVMKMVLIYLAVNLLAKYIVKTWGAKLGILLVLIGVVLTIIAPASGGTFLADFLIVTSQTLMQMSTALISAANEWIVDEANNTANDYKDFAENLKDRYSELQLLTEDTLGNRMDIDPLMFTRTQFIPVFESPDDMINRCLNLPSNTYAIASTACEHLVDRALTLKRNIQPAIYSQNLRA